MRKVEALKSGRYKVRFRLNGTQTSETFDATAAGKRDAERFAKWVDALGPQGAVDRLYETAQAADVPTLNQLAADHIEHLTGIEDGTRKNYERLWARTWGPRIGHLQAHTVTRDHIAQAVNDLGKHYSHKSLENQRGLLSGVIDRAVELEHLPKNVAKGVRLPRGQEANRAEMRILTADEFDTVADRMVEHYRPLLRFLYGTGCRWGEAVALQVQDVGRLYVDQRSNPVRDVRIRRALKWSPDNQRHVGATKTKNSNRTVVVGGAMLDDLAAACAGKSGSDLVFTAHRGGAVLHRTFWSRYWLPAVAHLKPRPRIHDLRHSHASWLLGHGVPIHVVQLRLGHESIQTTVDTYSHLLPDAQAMAAHAASLAFMARPAIEG